MRRVGSTLFVAMLLVGGFAPAAVAGDDEPMIVMSHLGGSLAVSLESVETVFYMEKDGKARFHVEWGGNPEGKTIEGPEASEVWANIQADMKDEFLWVTHMGGSLGIARDAVTSVFFLPDKDGKPATLRINYVGDAKTVEGAEAEALWAKLAK